jgi:CheY-like chemotaxis protein
MATILVCDNEEILRGLIAATLDGLGHELVEARDGHEALEVVKARPPDLVLLDMMMPGKSGLDVLRELRAAPELGDVPVVMLTARSQAEDRAAAASAGATRFLAKPFRPADLITLVEELLS